MNEVATFVREIQVVLIIIYSTFFQTNGQTRKNRDFNPYNCPVTHCMNKIGGKWKILIIYAISKNCNRFSKLKKALPVISKQMLVNQLRETGGG